MSNCSKHLTDIIIGEEGEIVQVVDKAYLVEKIGDLRYDTLSEFLQLLSDKILKDAEKDFNGGRILLANSLEQASINIEKSKKYIDQAWKISKPYMDV